MAADRRLAHIGVMLGHEALPYPPGRVTLLAWPALVFSDPTINDRRPLVHLRAGRSGVFRGRGTAESSAAPTSRRWTELTGQGPDRRCLLRRVGATDLLVELHLPLSPPHRPPPPARPVADPKGAEGGARSEEQTHADAVGYSAPLFRR